MHDNHNCERPCSALDPCIIDVAEQLSAGSLRTVRVVKCSSSDSAADDGLWHKVTRTSSKEEEELSTSIADCDCLLEFITGQRLIFCKRPSYVSSVDACTHACWRHEARFSDRQKRSKIAEVNAGGPHELSFQPADRTRG